MKSRSHQKFGTARGGTEADRTRAWAEPSNGVQVCGKVRQGGDLRLWMPG